jgi:maltose alpha-D-glucosyltransferase / alpha-amylase
MRSVDYAVATTLDPMKLAGAALPETVRNKFVRRLRDGAQKVFLDAYYGVAKDLPGLDNPDLLDFFLLEKAAYEVCYEAANRPNWLSIPLNGLNRVATRVLGRAK